MMKSEYNKVLMSYVCFKYFEPAQNGLVIVENRADRGKDNASDDGGDQGERL